MFWKEGYEKQNGNLERMFVWACRYACGVNSRAEEWREMKWRIKNGSTSWGLVGRK
jgi:hypothetical protein